MIGTLRGRGAEPAPDMPAIVTNEYGQGRVVYLPAGFDAAYYQYAYPYQRLVLAHAVRWAAARPPCVTVTAPMCVHASMMRQENDAREPAGRASL